MTTERRKRRTRLAALPPPTPPESSTHGAGVPLDSKGREMCTDHQNLSKEQPCPTCGKCHAHSSQTGDPCRRWPVPGGGVCATHGGSTTNARKAYARRLLDMVDPAMKRLGKIIDDDSVPPRDHIRAFTAVADRAGLGPSSKIELEAKRWEEVFDVVIVGDDREPTEEEWQRARDRYAEPEEDD